LVDRLNGAFIYSGLLQFLDLFLSILTKNSNQIHLFLNKRKKMHKKAQENEKKTCNLLGVVV